uniref:hypothetical protein n=1 Tax=Flavobacterium sp. TaxID=239 RepID=UPI00404AECB1
MNKPIQEIESKKKHKCTGEHSRGGNTIAPLRARHYCFTLNNWESSELSTLTQAFLKKKNLYFVIGKEVGKKGTPHLQGYVKHENAFCYEWLKKINNRMHIEKCEGDEKSNIVYCTKDGDYITNYSDSYIKGMVKPKFKSIEEAANYINRLHTEEIMNRESWAYTRGLNRAYGIE